MSSAALAEPNTPPAMWEKADTVLWAFTPDGIVLHNFARGLYVELDGPGHLVWSYLDGVHSSGAIAELLGRTPEYAQATRARQMRFVQQVVDELADGGFIRGIS